MNSKQVQSYVMKYLQATECQIIEKGRHHVTVKLSPQADKALTGRSYYWSFVERTGVEPETMTYHWIFDPDGAAKDAKKTADTDAQNGPGHQSGATAASSHANGQPAQQGPSSTVTGAPAGAPDSILGRYFGFVPVQPVSRVPQDVVTFGSRRLEQIFQVTSGQGRFVRLFEERKAGHLQSSVSVGYSSWLGVNFKVELACDMKRSELHSLGFNLGTGEIAEDFHNRMLSVKLTPTLPTKIHLLPTRFTASRAVPLLETYLEKKVKRYDHSWADEADERLREELSRIESYYEELLQSADEETKPAIEEQYTNRREEIEWQYKPRVLVSVINCGLFHLRTED